MKFFWTSNKKLSFTDPAHMLQVSSSSQQHVPVDISVGLPFAVYETVVESCKLSESAPSTTTETDHSYSRPLVDRFLTTSDDVEDKGTQTDLTSEDMNNTSRENEQLKAKLSDKDALLRNLFIEKVTKNDKSIQQYTGLPNLETFNKISDLTLKYEPNLKYWTGEHSENEKSYQNRGNKPGPSRKLSRFHFLTIPRTSEEVHAKIFLQISKDQSYHRLFRDFHSETQGPLYYVSPGDEIMADRGFTIRDLLTERHAYLNIPPFTRAFFCNLKKPLVTK
ncbi:uncharacterized protein LOC134272129 [Saccostrea cucullata]|uniref:uncharacterized protein LOC134272129 n=1 Tax=Saccostrea cuccullata TaxID=36930 RepID=UPI002ED3CC21